jgi:hypothetical protein
MKEKDTYLPKLEVPEAFIRDLRQSIEVYRPRVTDGKPELMPAPLKRNFALLALIADVGDVFANLNVVLEDLDKLEADPFAFGDTDPFARFKFLLRSIHAEFERFSGLFDQYLALTAASGYLTQRQRSRLKVIFTERVRSLLDAAEAEGGVTAHWYAGAEKHVTLLRGVAHIQSFIEAAQPNHTKAADWKKVLSPRVQSRRRMIFDAGWQIGHLWMTVIELATSVTVERRPSRLPSARRRVGRTHL